MRVRSASLFLTGAFALAFAVVGCGGGSKSASSTTEPGTTITTTTTTTTTSAVTTTARATRPSTTRPASRPVTITVRIKGGRPVGGIKRATAKKGQQVALVVHSDVADEIHVHGYVLSKDVKVGGTVRIQFKANIAGVFEAELESRSLQIAELTVR
jgi:hypothetical protein